MMPGNSLSNSFKDTEISPIPADWELAKLSDIVCSSDGIKRGPWGGSIRKDMFVSSGYKVYEQRSVIRNDFSLGHYYIDKDKFRELEAFAVREGDVLITAAGTIGKVALVPKEIPKGIINQALIRIRLKEDRVLNLFFRYLFEYYVSRGTLQNLSHGATLKNLASVRVLKELPIPLPSLPEQRRIAHVLSAIQRAIAAQDDLVAAAREVKRSLMQRLFTYGPGPEPAPMRETEIGEIPEHWKVVQLKDAIRNRIQNGAFIKREQFGDGVPFLNVADTYKSTVVNVRTLERVQCSQDEIEKFGLQRGDLIFVRSSLKREGVGQCILVEEVEEPTIYDCHLMRVEADTSIVVPRFLAYYSLSPQGKEALIAHSKTTTMTTINQAGLSSFVVPVPPLQEQQVIARSLEAVEQKIDAEEQRKAALQALFKAMLHQLMTGQIRISAGTDFHYTPF